MSKNSVAPTARLAHNAGALAYHHAAKKEGNTYFTKLMPYNLHMHFRQNYKNRFFQKNCTD